MYKGKIPGNSIPTLISTEATARKLSLTGESCHSEGVVFFITSCKQALGYDYEKHTFVCLKESELSLPMYVKKRA